MLAWRFFDTEAEIGMMEYALVFRRAVGNASLPNKRARLWVAVRPALPASGGSWEAEDDSGAADMAQVFVVPICSALDLDDGAYEHFLVQSGVIRKAVAMLGSASLRRPEAATTARKEIQSLVMAAEVEHIVNRISA